MKNQDSVQFDSNKVLTPSVAAFFASAQNHSCGFSSGSPKPLKESQLCKELPQEKDDKNIQKNILNAKKEKEQSKGRSKSKNSDRLRVQSDTPQTPKSTEKYAGSSFHRSPAAHTLPIPAFAKNLNSANAESPKSLPASFGFLSNESLRMEHSRNLLHMVKLSSNQENHSKNDNVSEAFLQSSNK